MYNSEHLSYSYTRRSLLANNDTANLKFTLFGGYAYKFNDKGYVKAVVDVVGPVDLTDPGYVLNPIYTYIGCSLVGSRLSWIRKHTTKPVRFIITNHSTPTIGFYGSVDPLVLSTQPRKLSSKLTRGEGAT